MMKLVGIVPEVVLYLIVVIGVNFIMCDEWTYEVERNGLKYPFPRF